MTKHERIRNRAYQIWEEEGRPEGADLRHWLQAADQLADKTDDEALRENLSVLGEPTEEGNVPDAPADGGGDPGDESTDRTPTEEPPPRLPEVEITTGKEPSRRKVKKTEGP